VLQSKPELEDRLAVLLGGRAAEELVFGEIPTGAHNDIERAPDIARHMVYEFGMSERLGPQAFTQPASGRFLGGPDLLGGRFPVSEATAELLDAEVAAFVNRAHARARTLLEEHRDGLTRLAERLRERETLEGEELKAVLADATRNGAGQPAAAPGRAAG
jgi:cell division protease FtsH